MNSEDILDTSQLNFEGDFDKQVVNILYRVRLTASEVHDLRFLFYDLEQALRTIHHDIKVMPFGSIVTGLGIKTSDVDCYVEVPGRKLTHHKHKHVITCRNLLKRYPDKFTNLFAILTAKVPIVKFLHMPTNCYCDVNFNSPAGVHNSKLVCHLLQVDGSDRALHLAILVKYWSKIHKITGTNLLASYALTLMVIFYLQLMNVLPSIYEMQKNVHPCMVDNWNMAFDININANVNNDSLYELLGGFFKCYSNLNFEDNIISTFMGRLLPRDSFQNVDDVPSEYKLYKEYRLTNCCTNLKIDTPVCIQDPFEHCRNASGTVFFKLAMKIKYHFQTAAKMFDELPPNQFLQAILRRDLNVQHFKPEPKQKQQHVFTNKIVKKKHKPAQSRDAPGTLSIMQCYEQIRKRKT